MLFDVTWLIVLCAMALSMWMAFYLFARGFPNWITLRAVIVLLSLSTFFLGTFNHIFQPAVGNSALRAVLLIIAMAAWFSLTFQLLPVASRMRLRWLELGIYALAALTATLLLSSESFVGEEGNSLYIAQMQGGFPIIFEAGYLVTVSSAILLNLIVATRGGATREGRYFLFASIFPIFSVLYSGIAIAGRFPLPRFISDLFILIGIFLLGLSVAYHESLIQRRTTLQDFPITSLTILGLTLAYVFIGRKIIGLPISMTASVVAFSILAHSIYDLVRELLERLRTRTESGLRKQLRRLEGSPSDEKDLQFHLQAGLNLLVQTLKASGGFIALKQGDDFVVTASRFSVPSGSQFPATALTCNDVSRTKSVTDIEWLAPAFEGHDQIAVLALGKPKARLDYSSGDLDVLSEVADQIGTIVSLCNRAPRREEKSMQLIDGSRTQQTELNAIVREMAESMSANPDLEFVRIVEFGLRHINDFIVLGESPLAEWAQVHGNSHVERGKHLQQWLIAIMESLRPSENRPGEPLPRAWYSYVVLHDAYVEGVQNREILSRLYISEGTFHRTRRNALRGFARLLKEEKIRSTSRNAP